MTDETGEDDPPPTRQEMWAALQRCWDPFVFGDGSTAHEGDVPLVVRRIGASGPGVKIEDAWRMAAFEAEPFVARALARRAVEDADAMESRILGFEDARVRLRENLRKLAVGPSDPRRPASFQSCKVCLSVWTHGERERHTDQCLLAEPRAKPEATGEPPREDDISPDVRDLVVALQAAGFATTDSGDGSNHAEGMECALPYRHVFILTSDPEPELRRLREFMAARDDGGEYEVTMFDHVEGEPDVLAVMEVGWEAKHDAMEDGR